MKKSSLRNLALLSTLSLTALTGCVGEIISSTDDTDGRLVEDSYMSGGSLYMDECSVVYTTNKLRAVTDKENTDNGRVTSYDDGGTITGGTTNVVLRDILDYSTHVESFNTPRVGYGETLETSITFPSYFSLYDIIGAGFDLYFTNLRIDYTNATSVDYTRADDGYTRDCGYIYFMTLYNKAYTGNRNVLAARTATTASTNGIELGQLQGSAGKNIDFAVAGFDMLTDYANSVGVTAKTRKELVKKLQAGGKLEGYKTYRSNIAKSSSNVKQNLAARTMNSAAALTLEKVKSSMGIGAPAGLVKTVEKMINFSKDL